jgi:hypothetical protein
VPLAEIHPHGFAGVINHYFVLKVDVLDPVSGVDVDVGAARHPDSDSILGPGRT